MSVIIQVWPICEDNSYRTFSPSSALNPLKKIFFSRIQISAAPLRSSRPACGIDKLFIKRLIHMLMASALYITDEPIKKRDGCGHWALQQRARWTPWTFQISTQTWFNLQSHLFRLFWKETGRFTAKDLRAFYFFIKVRLWANLSGFIPN